MSFLITVFYTLITPWSFILFIWLIFFGFIILMAYAGQLLIHRKQTVQFPCDSTAPPLSGKDKFFVGHSLTHFPHLIHAFFLLIFFISYFPIILLLDILWKPPIRVLTISDPSSFLMLLFIFFLQYHQV